MSDSLKEEALRYHRFPTAGKVSVTPTKALDNQRDLSLAYSPGVAFACQAIEADPLQADFLTSRANLVAVISNGSAVLGLGNIGALAGKRSPRWSRRLAVSTWKTSRRRNVLKLKTASRSG